MFALMSFFLSGGLGMALCGSAGKPELLRRMGCNYGISVSNVFPSRGNQSWVYLERGNLRANAGLNALESRAPEGAAVRSDSRLVHF